MARSLGSAFGETLAEIRSVSAAYRTIFNYVIHSRVKCDHMTWVILRKKLYVDLP